MREGEPITVSIPRTSSGQYRSLIPGNRHGFIIDAWSREIRCRALGRSVGTLAWGAVSGNLAAYADDAGRLQTVPRERSSGCDRFYFLAVGVLNTRPDRLGDRGGRRARAMLRRAAPGMPAVRGPRTMARARLAVPPLRDAVGLRASAALEDLREPCSLGVAGRRTQAPRRGRKRSNPPNARTAYPSLGARGACNTDRQRGHR